jgi:hypothetical protein
MDPFPKIIQIFLAVNHKREDGHLIDLVGISRLGDGRRGKGENNGEKQA